MTTAVSRISCHVSNFELEQYDDVSERGGEHCEEGGLVQGEVGGGAEGLLESFLEQV